MKKNKSHKVFKKYLVKKSDGLFIEDYSFFESVDSWIKALSIGTACYSQIQKVLIDDSRGDESFVGTMKVTTGLERTLIELNERYPQLMNEIHGVSLIANGIRVSRC